VGSSVIVRSVVLLIALAAAAAAVYGRVGRPSATSAASPQPIAGGSFEASGVVYVPGSHGVLFADDKDGRAVYWLELSANGAQQGPAQAVPLGIEIVDPEGLSTNGTHIFMVGSQSKGHDSGVALARFRFNAAQRRAQDVKTVAGLKQFLVDNVGELREHGGLETLNIEGLAWDPRAGRLLLGLREPLVDRRAVIVPLVFRDPNGPFALENLEVPGRRAISLSLGGAGIRSLEYDDRANAFRVIAGPAQDGPSGDFRLIEWEGREGSSLREVATFPRALKAEGITRAVIDGRPRTVVVFDAGQFVLYD
jgi:hypothetical protein